MRSPPSIKVIMYAAVRDGGEIGMGNILGANIMNALVVSGIAGLIRPIHEGIPVPDFILVLAGMLMIMWAMKREKRIPRWLGAIFVGIYLAFVLAGFVFGG